MTKRGKKTADIIVDTLRNWNVEVVFGLPGDGINGVFEALRKKKKNLKFILVRHEESAAFMACAYAKYTGKLGVCVATSGPGAIHLLNGLYDAKLDNTPVLAITGSTYSDLMGSGYHQDVDLVKAFSNVAKFDEMIMNAPHSKMIMDMACRSALSSKTVSHVTIPIDVQEQELDSPSGSKMLEHTTHSDHIMENRIPDKESTYQAAKILNSGKNIVILAGQGAIGAGEELIQLGEKLGAPIIKALLGKSVIPEDHPLNLGGLGMIGTEPASDAMSETDTLLLIGTSFPYLEYLPKPGKAKGVQIDINPEKLGIRYPIDVGLVGDSKSTIRELIPKIKKRTNQKFLKSKQKAMKEWNKKLQKRARKANPLKPQYVASLISKELKDNAIVSVDSGTNTVWAARYIDIKKGMKFSLSGTLASMACGLPYAIAGKIAYPKRQSVALVGDGGFTMLMGEFATAVQYNLPITVVVFKNNTLGMIRWEQMAFMGNPEYGVEFSDIDYARFAEVCGGVGYSVKSSEEAKRIIPKALKNEKPTILEVVVDPFEPPVPPKVNNEFAANLAKSFVKGQPYKERIGLTLFRDQIHEVLKKKK
ncbi:MAG: pyruvate oxidase [Nitrosopumilaceae archaeon]|nr:pyruvate oxidase [Nitrosopumilaceae archaeon]NIU00363.1 pyruvate oxidase [Nitrosopumilaceae archaeon]NIU86765.1 pyruvate oxidase [Nitrosopumilaceae archaeon]NIV65465.1 pyruvate oxidase [Nitrosopumilaceae archaeon]NIX60965.1 pyruvate oxidase [Nitrosopumilaceae archaeon]